MRRSIAVSFLLVFGMAAGKAHSASCEINSGNAMASYLGSANYYTNSYQGQTTRMYFSGNTAKSMRLKIKRAKGANAGKIISVPIKVTGKNTFRYKSDSGNWFDMKVDRKCKLRFSGNNHLVRRR